MELAGSEDEEDGNESNSRLLERGLRPLNKSVGECFEGEGEDSSIAALRQLGGVNNECFVELCVKNILYSE